MATSLLVRTDVSGTTYVLDVTELELNPSLSVVDFEVTHNGTIISSYTKTSATQLTYSGTNVTNGTRVIARRVTPIIASETSFLSTTTASELTNALAKLRQRNEELDARLSYVLAQITSGGVAVGSIPIDNSAYGAGWNGDNTKAPSRDATYDIIQTLAPINSPTFTGTPLAPKPTIVSNNFSIATTSFVKDSFVIGNSVLASANVQGNNTPVNTLSVTSALGSNSFRFALLQASFRISGFGKSLAVINSELRNNVNTVVGTTVKAINNVAYLDNDTTDIVRFISGTFTGSYSFSLHVAINAATTTDVYTLNNVRIDVLYIA